MYRMRSSRNRPFGSPAKALGYIPEHGSLTIQDFERLCPRSTGGLCSGTAAMMDIGLLVLEGRPTSWFTG